MKKIGLKDRWHEHVMGKYDCWPGWCKLAIMSISAEGWGVMEKTYYNCTNLIGHLGRGFCIISIDKWVWNVVCEPWLEEYQLQGGFYFHAQDPIPGHWLVPQVVLQKKKIQITKCYLLLLFLHWDMEYLVKWYGVYARKHLLPSG